VHALASIKDTQTECVAHPLARPGKGSRYAAHEAPTPSSPSPLPASATPCAAGLGPPGASTAALPPNTLPARASTPPPLAPVRPKLQLGRVQVWRCRAAPMPAWISYRWRHSTERLSCSRHSGRGCARSTGMPMPCRAAASCSPHDLQPADEKRLCRAGKPDATGAAPGLLTVDLARN
jgi:hypothetical protein